MKDKDLLRDKSKLLPGSGLSWHAFKSPSAEILNCFDNPGVTGTVTVSTDELTALCPLTSFPDQYTVTISYVPDKRCVESKSAKFYFGSFRNFQGFIEALAVRMYNDWAAACSPKELVVDIVMKSRGGVVIRVRECGGKRGD